MRQRHTLGSAVAAAALVASTVAGSASADPADSHSAADPAPAEAVVLPTGDQAHRAADGTIGLLPAEGRERIGILTVPTADGSGDLLAVPHDKIDDLRSGAEDARRYNVTRLLEDGHDDAAAVPEAALAGYAGLPGEAAPDGEAAAQPLTLALRDRAGDTPDGDWVIWADDDDPDNVGLIEFDEHGVGTVDLAPGEYTLSHSFWNDATETDRGETVLGMTPVSIGEEPVDLVIDAAAAEAVTVSVERPDARMHSAMIAISAQSEYHYLGINESAGPTTDVFLMPEPELPGYRLSFLYRPILTGPEDAAEPYAYHLAFAEPGSFPDDPAFAVADAELAAVRTEYGDLGVPVDGYTCDYGDVAAEQIGNGICRLLDTPTGTERIDYFTAEPEIAWISSYRAGRFEGVDLLEGFFSHWESVFEPGSYGHSLPHGPFTGGPAFAALSSFDGLLELSANATPGESANGERAFLTGYEGSAVLSREGEEIGRLEDIAPRDGFGFDITGAEAGDYALAVEADRDPATGLFAVKSHTQWSFALDPGEVGDGQFLRFSLPAVTLAAEGVEGGYAEAGRPQELTLVLTDSDGAQVRAAEMTLELSYDDGITWTEVPLDVDDGFARATVDHPDGAEFVSVRTAATDDAGGTVAQTTIRAFGLR